MSVIHSMAILHIKDSNFPPHVSHTHVHVHMCVHTHTHVHVHMCACAHKDTYPASHLLTFKNFYQSASNQSSFSRKTDLISNRSIHPVFTVCTVPSALSCLSPASLQAQIPLIFEDPAQVPLSLIPWAKSNFPVFWSLDVTSLVCCWGGFNPPLHFSLLRRGQWKNNDTWYVWVFIPSLMPYTY